MRILILGAGKQAQGAAYFIENYAKQKIDSVHVCDRYLREAEQVADYFSSIPVSTSEVDAENTEEMCKLLKKADVVLNALPYRFAFKIAELAIESRTHLVDLGGNSEIVDKQFGLFDRAINAGVAIIPDCGIAPGFVSLLVQNAVKHIENPVSVKAYVGGLPCYPNYAGPLQYGDFFSTEGLLNEYSSPVTILRDGEITTIEALDELETISISTDKKFWTDLEAFATSGGISTLPSSYKDKLQTLEYKTLRFPGHHRQLMLLKEVGCFNAETFKKLLRPMSDQIFLKVVAEGTTSDNAAVTRTYVMHVIYDEFSGLTAMMQCTAFSAAFTMLLLGDSLEHREIPPGVWSQEQVIDSNYAIKELAASGLCVTIEDTIKYVT